jgi:ABC-type transport system involved in multi-copper enzyme maturation permease subunit
VLVANLGLFASVVCTRAGNASALTAALVAGSLFGGWIFEALEFALVQLSVIPQTGTLTELLGNLAAAAHRASIHERISEIATTGLSDAAIGFQVVASLAGGGLAFLLSWLLFGRFASEKRLADQSPMQRFARFRRAVTPRPRASGLVWKEFHLVTGGVPAQIFKFVAYGSVTALILAGAGPLLGTSTGEAGMYVVDAMLVALAVEGCLYASRVFHDEWKNRTLPLLLMLPISTSRIVRAKFAGCLPAMAPGFFWLLVGALVWPDGLWEVGRALLLPSRWVVLLVYLLLLTLTAFFSLVVRWGALPLALAVMLGASTIASCCFSPLFGIFMMASGGSDFGPEVAAFCVDTVLVLLIAGLQFDIHRRIEIVASR